ncbi:TPR-like protein [Rhizopogon vinicolor AM-OR11-026]|uniref:TPR-like protein n=1 Tax=Rhizopogon vinicolor AM-OR11-026 TaxID=1314800 RepID=A0A1B7ML03_9AGAM|nr:TPR-like protein [Rhizopogon vinicolor AM-OR11-026]
MSLQGLISGSECAVPFNPLSQVLKHTEGDRTLQQDRVAGSSSSRLQHLPGSAPAQAAEQDVAMARQFFEGQQRLDGPAFAAPPHFHPAELARMGHLELNDAWTRERSHQPTLHNNMTQNSWATEFGGAQQQSSSGPSMQHSIAQISEGELIGSHGVYGSPIGSYRNMGPSFFQGFNVAPPSVADASKGKGKAREADFEAAFAQVAASLQNQQQSSSGIVELDDTTASLEQAMESVKLGDPDMTNADFKDVWDHLQHSDIPPPLEDIGIWESQFNQLMGRDREELDRDYSEAMQEAWNDGLGNFNQSAQSLDSKFTDDGIPILPEYVFDRNNKYLDQPSLSRSPLSEAKAFLEQGGSLSEAALLLEAAIQQGELGEGGYEAWILLGETRNMDEREELGLRALTEGVRRSEAANANGAGMLSLAISYTNESYDRAAYNMLLRWLHARFPDFPIPDETQQAVSLHSTWDSHEKLTETFLALARHQYNQGIVDPETQIALGVLFYTTTDYERAKDCFESALSQRPRDYLLWNRLGSSLSNGNKPEEALGAYREALNLRPTYTRVIYNVGVACLNIGAHKEAAEHFLSALIMQESTNGQTSDQLWFTLRRAFIAMDRSDLAELAKPESRSNLDFFRQQGFDF